MQVDREKGRVQTDWARDFGYMFRGNKNEQMPILYGEFREGYEEHVQAKASHAGVHRWDTLDVLHEGGNLLATGTGICLSTTKRLMNYLQGDDACLSQKPSASRPLDDEALREKVVAGMVHLGCHTWIFVENPLNEKTGHIDVFVGQVEDTTFVVGEGHSNQGWYDASILGSAFEKLRRLGKMFDFNVEKLPMPPLIPDRWSDNLADFENHDIKSGRNCWLLRDGAVELTCKGQHDDCCAPRYFSLWRSYTNFLPVKREGKPSRVIIPSFAKAGGGMGEFASQLEAEEVTSVLGRYFDELLWVDQVERVKQYGSVHCLTRGVPTKVPMHMLPCGVLEK